MLIWCGIGFGLLCLLFKYAHTFPKAGKAYYSKDFHEEVQDMDNINFLLSSLIGPFVVIGFAIIFFSNWKWITTASISDWLNKDKGDEQ